MTPHPRDSGREPDPRRRVRTARGETLEAAEPYLAAQASRLLTRLGLGRYVNGFAVWRAYTVARTVWRLRAGRPRRPR